MLTLIIAAAIGIIAGFAAYGAKISIIWSMVIGFGALVLVQLLIGLLVRRKINVINDEIQSSVSEGQRKLDRKLQQFQMRPQGSMKSMQKTLENEQNSSIRQALKITGKADTLFKWNFLLRKQINTMKMTFYFQLREFKKVDALLNDCLLMDVHSCCMKMARLYMLDRIAEADKLFKRKRKKFKSSDDAALFYGLYSWILVNKERIEDAIKVLEEAKTRTDHECIKNNWDALVNGKVRKFSNARLGEIWYALYLEKPRHGKGQKAKRVYA